MGNYEHTTEIAELVTALAAAQAEMKNPGADSDNPHFKTKYASLAAVRDAITPPLTKQGIAVTQLVDTGEKSVSCTTILFHKSGQWLKMTLTLPVNQPTAQGFGGATTYARRYSLMAICNVAGDEDDDGHSASTQTPPHRKSQDKTTRPSPGIMYQDEPSPEMRGRQQLGAEITAKVHSVITPLKHPGLYKSVLHHCFEATPDKMRDLPLSVLEAGMPLFRHLCDELQAHGKPELHPDEWVAHEQRKLAALATGHAQDEDEGGEPEGPSWGPDSPDLMAEDEAEDDPWGRPSAAAYPQP